MTMIHTSCPTCGTPMRGDPEDNPALSPPGTFGTEVVVMCWDCQYLGVFVVATAEHRPFTSSDRARYSEVCPAWVAKIVAIQVETSWRRDEAKRLNGLFMEYLRPRGATFVEIVRKRGMDGDAAAVRMREQHHILCTDLVDLVLDAGFATPMPDDYRTRMTAAYSWS